MCFFNVFFDGWISTIVTMSFVVSSKEMDWFVCGYYIYYISLSFQVHACVLPVLAFSWCIYISVCSFSHNSEMEGELGTCNLLIKKNRDMIERMMLDQIEWQKTIYVSDLDWSMKIHRVHPNLT